MKKPILFFAFATILLAILTTLQSCKTNNKPTLTIKQPADYVMQTIGTGGHGHVFVGANVPFGAVQVGPQNLSQGWDWCSGYHESDSTICGFSQTHLSGTGIGDLGDIALMPAVGNVTLAKGKAGDYNSGFFSNFKHSNEKMKPGYYSVILDRNKVTVEITATSHVAFHKYSFPKSDEAKIIFDLWQGIGWDGTTETYIKRESETAISGFRYSKGWAADQQIYFYAELSKPMSNFAAADSSAIQKDANELKSKKTMAVATFSTADNEAISVKIAISSVSIANAKENMKAELPDWDFAKTAQNANNLWNNELAKVEIDATDSVKSIFYTALYHTMIAPSEFSDVNGEYRGPDKQIHKNTTGKTYTTYSLWDTYRAAHPLMTIIHPEKVADMVNTMLQIFQQQGKLPVWHLVGNETDCMVGNPGIIVVGDAIMKGFGGIDYNTAFEAMKTSAMLDERGMKFLKSPGYIPADKESESVAKALEYAIADMSIAQVAKKLGKESDYQYFKKRGEAYQNYFDKSLFFMRGKIDEKTWRTPFNPFRSSHRQDDFTEGNSWQYTWLVPQDVEGLVSLFGSEAKFTEKLDSLFIVQGDLGAEASPDISGLIGQYAHGNEPSHHIAYLYNYVGQPWKTAEKVRNILKTMYSTKADGLSGNEDVGQMSAWYVLSAMGFYQVNPANNCYLFGSPAVNSATINFPNGKKFNIKAEGNSNQNIYIQSVTLNGKPFNKSYITFTEIINGGNLVMKMGNTPSKTWGVNTEDRATSEVK